MTNEIDSLRAEKSILTDHFGENTVYEILKRHVDKATGVQQNPMATFMSDFNKPPNATLGFGDMQVTNIFNDLAS